MSRSKKLIILSVITAIMVAGYLAQILFLSLYESFVTRSKSMIPTLLPGDRLYARIGLLEMETTIVRGTLILFHYDEKTQYIFRVIGMPGDKVSIRDTTIRINGNRIRRKAIACPDEEALSEFCQSYRFYQEWGDQGSYNVMWQKTAKRTPVDVTVPENAVFVLGDNRDNAYDSRFYGSISADRVSGIASWLWLSYHPDTGLQPQRMFRSLQPEP